MAGNAAEAAIELGEWEHARELVTAALRDDPTGNHWIHQRRLLAVIKLWMDDDRDAVAEILTDLGRFSQIAVNGPQYHAGISSVRAELALARNDPVTAWRIVQEATDSFPWSGARLGSFGSPGRVCAVVGRHVTSANNSG
ncbi:hypothetical protein [Microlunatus endophyticus]